MREERHAVLQPEDERCLTARRHNGVGLVGGDDRNGEGAPQSRQYGPHHNYAIFDISRAKKDLGWTPRFPK